MPANSNDVFKEVVEVQVALARLEEKFDAHARQSDKDDHDRRIRRLERGVLALPPAILAIAVGVAKLVM